MTDQWRHCAFPIRLLGAQRLRARGGAVSSYSNRCSAERRVLERGLVHPVTFRRSD